MAIGHWKDVSAKSNARWLIKSITESTFIVTLFSCVIIKYNVDQLSKSLQQNSTCLTSAISNVGNIISVLVDDRPNNEDRFKGVMQLIYDTISCLQLGMECPRIGKRSTHRSNPEVVSVSDYFRITIFIPFLDSVIQQLKIRFREKTQHVGIFNILQPKKKKKGSAPLA